MKKEYLFAFGSIFLWSTVATITKLLLNQIDVFQVLWISSLFAALFLLLFNIVTGRIRKLKKYGWKDYAIMYLSGCPGTLLYYVFYYGGTARMPASQAFIVNYLWPVMSILFASLVLKEKMTVKKCLAVGISFLGVIIVVCGDLSVFQSDILMGAFLCFLGAVSYGAFTALTRRFPYESPLLLMVNYGVNFLITTVLLGVNGDLFVPAGMQIPGLLYNGALTIAAASLLWLMALQGGKTERIANLAYITPVLSLVWTALILKETLTLSVLLGFAVVLLGIFIQFTEGKDVFSFLKRKK